MRSNTDKIAQICALYWMPVSEADIEDCPGSPYIFISGLWTVIPFSSSEFKEELTENGNLIAQEFKCTVTGVNQKQESVLKTCTGEYGLLRIDYTNGDVKVVGTEQVPVKLSLEISGSPSAYGISFKRNSAELSKFFKSF